jgi:hypothetical protein
MLGNKVGLRAELVDSVSPIRLFRGIVEVGVKGFADFVADEVLIYDIDCTAMQGGNREWNPIKPPKQQSVNKMLTDGSEQ